MMPIIASDIGQIEPDNLEASLDSVIQPTTQSVRNLASQPLNPQFDQPANQLSDLSVSSPSSQHVNQPLMVSTNQTIVQLSSQLNSLFMSPSVRQSNGQSIRPIVGQSAADSASDVFNISISGPATSFLGHLSLHLGRRFNQQFTARALPSGLIEVDLGALYNRTFDLLDATNFMRIARTTAGRYERSMPSLSYRGQYDDDVYSDVPDLGHPEEDRDVYSHMPALVHSEEWDSEESDVA